MFRFAVVAALSAFVCCSIRADDAPPKPDEKPGLADRFKSRMGWSTPPVKNAMPLTALAPSVISPGLCVYHYPISTSSKECQAYCDQALGYYYSYVYMEAARSFETALKHDPESARAWLGLHMALTKWGKTTPAKPDVFLAIAGASMQPKAPERFTKSVADYALHMSQKLMAKANDRERMLIQAKLQEKGLWPDTPAEERKKKATATLDELITLYEDDEEAWYARAQIAEGQHGGTPFYKALLKLNPLHPGANHELVHFYENIRRPALGWPYAEAYIQSSPGIPHAFHMQAHLGTRVGKWKQTTDWSWKAVELERAYHKLQNVKPEDDQQFFHHMEILTKSLLHDGRLKDAATIKAEAQSHKLNMRPEWFRLALMQKDWPEAQKIVAHYKKTDKATGAYYGALLALEQNDLSRASAELDVLRQAAMGKRSAAESNLKLLEIQGRILCRTGQGEAGVKLLRKTVDKTKNDFFHHSWGNGAYYMETWGMAAMDAGLVEEAEEAFLEALAHDSGSLKAVLGLRTICAKTDRLDEAQRYAKLFDKWSAKADSALMQNLKREFSRTAETAANNATESTEEAPR
jgi:hypothetical protein